MTGSGIGEPEDRYKTVFKNETKREARELQKGNLPSPKIRCKAGGYRGEARGDMEAGSRRYAVPPLTQNPMDWKWMP